MPIDDFETFYKKNGEDVDAPPHIRPVADKRIEDCVAVLTAALEHAKAGDYSSITIMAESTKDDAMFWFMTPCKESFVELLGKLDVLKWQVYRRMTGTCEK